MPQDAVDFSRFLKPGATLDPQGKIRWGDLTREGQAAYRTRQPWKAGKAGKSTLVSPTKGFETYLQKRGIFSKIGQGITGVGAQALSGIASVAEPAAAGIKQAFTATPARTEQISTLAPAQEQIREQAGAMALKRLNEILAPQQAAPTIPGYEEPRFGQTTAFTPQFLAALQQFKQPEGGTFAQQAIGMGSQLAGMGAGAGLAALGLGPLGIPLGGLIGTGVGALGEYLYRKSQEPSAAQQDAQMQQLVASVLGGGQGFQFAPIAQQARTQFEQRTIPMIAERFNVMGGARSGAFRQALGAAGAGLEESLAAMQAKYTQAESRDVQERLKLAMQGLKEDRAHQLERLVQAGRERTLGVEERAQRLREVAQQQSYQEALARLGVQGRQAQTQEVGAFGDILRSYLAPTAEIVRHPRQPAPFIEGLQAAGEVAKQALPLATAIGA